MAVRLMAPLSVSTRVALMTTLILLFIWLAALLVGVYETRTLVADALGERAQAVAGSVALSVGPALAARDLALAQATLDSVFDENNHRHIALLDGANVEVLASRSNSSRGRAPSWFTRIVGLEAISARAPITAGAGNHSIVVELKRGAESAALWRYVTVITWAFLIGTMLLLLYLVSSVRGALAPLSRLTRQLINFRQGNFKRLEGSLKQKELVPAFVAADVLSQHMEAQNEEWQESVSLLENQIEQDPLTGLANRTGLERALERTDGPGAFALIRLEELRTVERQHGALGVDRVVAQFASQLKGHGFGDEENRLGRLDSGAFVCLRHASGSRVASELARRLADRIAESAKVDHQSVMIGVVSFSSRQRFNDLLAAAEHTLDAARRDSSQNWAVRALPDRFEASALSPRSRFIQALDTRELELRFRPSLGADGEVLVSSSIASLNIDGMALSGERLGDAAEQMSCRERLDTAIVSWVLAELSCCEDRLAASVGRWILNVDGLTRLIQTLDPDEEVDWSRIVFEIEEIDLVEHGTDGVEDVIEALAQRGSALAVVNAGMSSSALGYLRSVKLAYVKIAGVIGRCLESNREARFVAEGLVAMARRAEVPIILTGIDTRAIRSSTLTKSLIPAAWEGDYSGVARLAEVHRNKEPQLATANK